MQDDTVTLPVEVPAEAIAEAVAADEPELDPNRLIDAEVAIAQAEEETERAKIAARTAVKIAEIQAEEYPEWLNDMKASLTRLETKVTEMEARLSSIPPASTVIMETAPEPEPEPTMTPEPDPVAVEVTPEPSVVPEPEPAPRPRRRWI